MDSSGVNDNGGDADSGGSGSGSQSRGGVSVGSSTRSVPAPRWLGKRVGRFKLLALLGNGAMGRVFRAEDTVMGRHVALKLLSRSNKRSSAANGAEVLIHEARSAATIEHPNAVQIYEVNQAGDVCYVAMELLEGGNLRDLVRAAGPLDVTRASLLCAEAADALAAAHAAGVVHRDVKPANLMLSRQGRCKVVDFGLARLDGLGDWSAAAESVGTPQFVAPEILRGTPASAQSDIYSLGGSLWYLLTGHPPYQSKDVRDLLRMHMESPVPDLKAARPDVPQGLADAVSKAMAKQPGDRFNSMAQLAKILRIYAIPVGGNADNTGGSLADLPVLRPSSPLGGRSGRAPTPSGQAPPQPESKMQVWLSKIRQLGAEHWAWVGLGAAALALVGAIVGICVILFHSPPPPAQSNASSVSPSEQPAPVPQPAEPTVTAPPTTPPLPSEALRLGDFEQQTDIGDVGHPGDVEFDAARHRYTVSGAGKDIFNRADAFHFVYRKLSGDVTLRANIAFRESDSDPARKAVLMIRQSLDPGSPFVDAAVHGDGAIALQSRPKDGGTSQTQISALKGRTVWLERHDNLFTLYVSNAEHKPVTTASLTIPMTDPVYIGLGVDSHDVSETTTAVFSNFEVKNKAVVP